MGLEAFQKSGEPWIGYIRENAAEDAVYPI
jgi:hypothetical protein